MILESYGTVQGPDTLLWSYFYISYNTTHLLQGGLNMEHRPQVIYKVGYFMPDLGGYIWNQFKDEKLAEDKARSLKESGYDVLVQKKVSN